MKKTFEIVCVAAIVAVLGSAASAGWTSVPMTNPGAETGDLTGWDTYDNRFIAVQDPSAAYEGDHYFFSQASRSANNGVSFNQDVDMSAFTGRILNVEVTTAYRYQTGQRWGYDAETDTEYLYDWEGSFGINAYSDAGHLFGISFTLPAGESWDTQTIPFDLRSDWDTKRDVLSRINVSGKVMYMPVNSGDPGSYNIESWGAWVGDEPTFIGFDAFETNVEVIPEPATMSLLALGGLAALRRRRR
ncbi:MAG: PEP-CTERM sorting domain-containing protein [Phycisphaerae bacterium]|nr:PEP-CTERM sorting domain-containing protein [Phycisphaerae bacterium]